LHQPFTFFCLPHFHTLTTWLWEWGMVSCWIIVQTLLIIIMLSIFLMRLLEC
jgi:hypothetical protein